MEIQREGLTPSEDYYDFDEILELNEKLLKEKKEKDWETLLEDKAFIELYDFEKGYREGFYDTSEDDMRIDFAYHFNSDLRDINGVSGVSSLLGIKSSLFPESWWLAEGAFYRSNFQEIGESGLGASATVIPNRTDTQIFFFGLGYGLRYHILTHLIDSEKLFENLNFTINYAVFDEDDAGFTFKGYGIKSSYALNQRVSKSFFYGLQLSYHIFLVKRGLEANESGYSRKLTLSWLDLSFGLGFEI
jgi:hypothetical protein